MKKLLLILFVLLSFNGFSQIVRTLSNVNNTADSLKPISKLEQGALAGKQGILSGTGFLRLVGTTATYDNTSYLPLTGGIIAGTLNVNSFLGVGGNIGITAGQYISSKDNGGTYRNLLGYDGGSNFYVGDVSNAVVGSQVVYSANAVQSFYTNGIERTRITQAGNIGIGNSNPLYKLDILGNARITDATNTGNLYLGDGTINKSPGSPFILGGGIVTDDIQTRSYSTNSYNVNGIGSITNGLKFTLASNTSTNTTTLASGAVPHNTNAVFNRPTFASTNLGVVNTLASNVYIDGAPIAGTNTTITNPFALYVNSGNSYFGGNVGIGNAIPVSRLSIQSTGAVANQVVMNLNNPYAYGTGLGQGYSTLRFTRSPNDAGSTGVMSDISGGNEIESSSTLGFLAFNTRNGATETTVERMRINSSGNVGIGTTNITQKLNVVGQGVFGSSGASYDSGDGFGSATRIGYSTSGDYGYIIANNTGIAGKNLILQPTGAGTNVGVGTLAPAFKLDVTGVINSSGSLNLGGLPFAYNDGTYNRVYNRLTQAVFSLGSTESYYDNSFHIFRNSAGSQMFRLDGVNSIIQTNTTRHLFGAQTDDGTFVQFAGAVHVKSSGYFDGNVGIGTTNPIGIFGTTTHINGATGASLNLTGTTSSGYLTASDALGAVNLSSNNTLPLSFTVNSSEKMRILSTGNVGIGTTTPNAKVEVFNGSLLVNVPRTATGTIIPIAVGTQRYTGLANSGLAGMYHVESGTSGFGQAGSLAFYTSADDVAGTEKLRITNLGNVGIGTLTPLGTLQIGDFNSIGKLNDVVLFAPSNAIGTGNSIKFDMNVGGGVTRSRLAEIQSLSYQGAGYNQLRFNLGTWNNSAITSNVMTLQDNGFVGIGNIAPLFNLHTTGTIKSDKLIVGTNIDNGNAFQLVGNTTMAGNVTVGNSINTATGLNVTGNGGFYNAASKFGIDYSNGASRFYSSGANATTKGNYEFHGIASDGVIDNIQLSINSANTVIATIGAINNGSVTVGFPSTISNSLFVNTASLNTTYNSGLGIDGTYSTATSIGNSIVNVKAIGVQSGGGYESTLAFSTGLNGVVSEKMRITSGGYVGIGTIAPVSPFHVKLATNQNIFFAANQNGGETGTAGIISINDANSAYAPLGFYASKYNFGGGNLIVNSNADNGNKLQVNGNASITGNLGINTGTFRFTNTLGGLGEFGRIGAYNTIGTVGEASSVAFIRDAMTDGNYGAVTINTFGSERMRIGSNGYVGVGTTAPITNLDVVGGVNASSAYYLGGVTFANNAGLSTVNINARVISNNSGTGNFTDGLFLGYNNSGNGTTRIYDGGTANSLLLNNATFSTVGFAKFLFGNQTDDGKAAQFASSVSVKGLLNTNSNLVFGINNSWLNMTDASGIGRRMMGLSTNNVLYVGDVDNTIIGSQTLFATNTNHLFYINGLEKARFIQNGNFGLNITAPRLKMEIAATTIVPTALSVVTADGNLLLSDGGNLGVVHGISNYNSSYQGYVQVRNNTASSIAYNYLINPLGGNVGIGGSTVNASAILDITSTTKGVLLPRMTTGQRDAITTVSEGLKIYNLTTHSENIYNGTIWADNNSYLPLTGGILTGTSGSGFVSFPTQSANPATPTSGFSFYANAIGALSWKGANGFVQTFDGTANTADQIYTLQNKSGVIAHMSDVNTKSTLIISATFSAIPVQVAGTYQLILVLVDETNGNAPTLYFYDGTGLQWLPTTKLY